MKRQKKAEIIENIEDCIKHNWRTIHILYLWGVPSLLPTYCCFHFDLCHFKIKREICFLCTGNLAYVIGRHSCTVSNLIDMHLPLNSENRNLISYFFFLSYEWSHRFNSANIYRCALYNPMNSSMKLSVLESLVLAIHLTYNAHGEAPAAFVCQKYISATINKNHGIIKKGYIQKINIAAIFIC